MSRHEAPPTRSRREFLKETALGFGSLALTALVAQTADATSPLAARTPHFRPRTKRVILLFMEGGPSHVDLIDYKPELFRRHGQRLPFDLMPQHWREGRGEYSSPDGKSLVVPAEAVAYFQQAGLAFVSKALRNVSDLPANKIARIRQ